MSEVVAKSFRDVRASRLWVLASTSIVLAATLSACSSDDTRGAQPAGADRTSNSGAPSATILDPATTPSATSVQVTNRVVSLCSKLDLGSLATAVPGTGRWVRATPAEITIANLDALGHEPDCILFPAAQRPLTIANGAPNDYVMFTQAVTPLDFQFLEREASLSGDFPPISIGDEGHLNAGLSGYLAFRVGQRWFNLQVRLSGPSDPLHEVDQNAMNQLAPQLGSDLAAAISRL